MATPSTLKEVTLSTSSIMVVGGMSRLSPLLKTISSLVFAWLRRKLLFSSNAFRCWSSLISQETNALAWLYDERIFYAINYTNVKKIPKLDKLNGLNRKTEKGFHEQWNIFKQKDHLCRLY